MTVPRWLLAAAVGVLALLAWLWAADRDRLAARGSAWRDSAAVARRDRARASDTAAAYRAEGKRLAWELERRTAEKVAADSALSRLLAAPPRIIYVRRPRERPENADSGALVTRSGPIAASGDSTPYVPLAAYDSLAGACRASVDAGDRAAAVLRASLAACQGKAAAESTRAEAAVREARAVTKQRPSGWRRLTRDLKVLGIGAGVGAALCLLFCGR